MRGPALDDRLEAIAGKPALDLSGLSPVLGITVPTGTAVVVGRYVPRIGQDPSFGQAFVYNGANYWQTYVLGGGEWRATRSPGDLVLTKTGGVFAASATTLSTEKFRLGNTTTPGWEWEGPIRGVIYDRPLTYQQVRRVIQHLRAHL